MKQDDTYWIMNRVEITRRPKGAQMALCQTIRDARREVRHAKSMSTSKQHGRKCEAIGVTALAAAIRWHGQTAVCRAVKLAKDAKEAQDAIAKLYAIGVQPA